MIVVWAVGTKVFMITEIHCINKKWWKKKLKFNGQIQLEYYDNIINLIIYVNFKSFVIFERKCMLLLWYFQSTQVIFLKNI